MNKQAMRNAARLILTCMLGGVIYLSVILFAEANEAIIKEDNTIVISEEVFILDETYSFNMSAGVHKVLWNTEFIDTEEVEYSDNESENVQTGNTVTEPENLAKDGTQYKYYKIVDNGYQKALDEDLQEYTYDLCVDYGITEYYTLILCQLYKESTYRENLISETNDYGIAQINISNHDWLSEVLGVTDFLDARQSILCNIYLMSDYIEKYGVESALVCYNTGKPYSSNPYARKIIDLWNNCIVEK